MKKNTLYILIAAAAVYYIINKSKAAKKTDLELKNFIPDNLVKIPILPSIPVDDFGPISVTQSELVTFPQLSPTPASVLDANQLIKFNTINKGQLSGVC